MSNARIQRVSGLIKKEVSELIRELKDPRISPAITSITDVQVSRDLSHAWVYVSILKDEQEKEEIVSVLDKARGFVRTELGKRIRLRHIPEIHFISDDSIAHGARIDEVLKSLKQEEEKEEEEKKEKEEKEE